MSAQDIDSTEDQPEREVGRPTKYQADFARQAEQFCLLGATDKQLADFFQVSLSTLNLWKIKHKEFSDALKDAKEVADRCVERSLYQRAMGYSHPDVHISNYQGAVTVTPITKHYPPDATSCIFWLKNRQPALWRDRHELTGKDGEPLQGQLTDIELARRIAMALTSAEVRH